MMAIKIGEKTYNRHNGYVSVDKGEWTQANILELFDHAFDLKRQLCDANQCDKCKAAGDDRVVCSAKSVKYTNPECGTCGQRPDMSKPADARTMCIPCSNNLDTNNRIDRIEKLTTDSGVVYQTSELDARIQAIEQWMERVDDDRVERERDLKMVARRLLEVLG